MLNISCSKNKEFQNPLNEERLSVEFLISLIMAANKVKVSQVDVMFSDQSATLANIQTTTINASTINNDKLWTILYTTGITYTIPPQWVGKTVTVIELANGVSAKSSFQIN
jgi:hypothetical protein